MKKLFFILAVAAFAGCSGSDDDSNVELYLTSDGVQKPFFAETTNDVNADGAAAVLVFADNSNENEQITFDVLQGATGDNVIDHVAFIPNASGTVFYPSDVFFSEVTLNSDKRIKGSFSGNVTDGETEQYIECTFNIKKTSSN